MSDRLEPMHPVGVTEIYLRERATDASNAAIQTREDRLGHFIRRCDTEDIDNITNLVGRDPHEDKC